MFRQQDAVKYFRDHEGVVNHMYLDIVGLVTIGVGFMLPDPRAAAALHLVNRETGAAATDAEKSGDWESVKAQVMAQRASAYRKFTKLDMADAEIDNQLLDRIGHFADRLRTRFPGFDEFPDQAQIGLLDMAYSLGADGLFSKFPMFCAAVDRQDWNTSANESSRRNVSDSRNADLKRLFLDAAAGSTIS